MEKSIMKSLVGVSIECRSSGEKDSLIINQINVEKAQIVRLLRTALSESRASFIRLAASIYDYHRHGKFFQMYKGAFDFGRMRKDILDYIEETTVNERQFNLFSHHSKGSGKSSLKAIEYFLRLYPSRLDSFKSCLSREEFNEIRCAIL